MDRDRLQQAIEHWDAVHKLAGSHGIPLIEGMRLLAGASADLRSEAETEAERHWVHVTAGDGMGRILAGMRRPETLAPINDGALRGTLRPYQRDGVAWMVHLTRLGLGACLADDMGLGKTIQVLALLLFERIRDKDERRTPSLLVVPAFLLGNWRAEADRFAPSLDLRFLHPSETERETLQEIAAAPAQSLAGVDLAVTTYAMLARQPWLAQVRWRLVILDEAQAIKNPGTKQSRAARKLQADARIAMTGTPVENRPGDLWTLFDFLNPGLLGSRTVFQRFMRTLQERDGQQFAPLRQLVAPYILRRLKTDRRIIDDLPDKTETARYCQLTRTQVALYRETVRSMKRSLEAVEGIRRRGVVLQTLMRLKQVCNHPGQLTGDGVYQPSHSGKFQRVAEICAELAERQERALVFTQFREIIDPLFDHLADVGGRVRGYPSGCSGDRAPLGGRARKARPLDQLAGCTAGPARTDREGRTLAATGRARRFTRDVLPKAVDRRPRRRAENGDPDPMQATPPAASPPPRQATGVGYDKQGVQVVPCRRCSGRTGGTILWFVGGDTPLVPRGIHSGKEAFGARSPPKRGLQR